MEELAARKIRPIEDEEDKVAEPPSDEEDWDDVYEDDEDEDYDDDGEVYEVINGVSYFY